MAFIKCKICGGDVEVIQGKTWGTCDYCGSQVTFPKDTTEQRVNLFNRADAFRRQNEFDKAISAYERILEEDQTDAEAHWGAVISRFGIEYVENPLNGERKPTLHRLQTTSILADEDYKAAIENAPDEETKKLYEQQAQEIADIQKKVLEQSEREEQYDIFLSYKETDNDGERTRDSVLAFDIYNALTREGYNVFYAKESLKGRLGDEYEPIIFSALRSSQVMILIGTKKEYFEAEWVRNEWTRYLDIMRQEKDKPQDEQIPRQLIPCYRDMDAYELPVELNMLQSMNMNSLGFLQDLISGVKKIMEGANQNTYMGKTDEISRLLQRAMNMAELGDFTRADSLAEKVLETDPNNAPAQMVKLLVQLKVNTPDELVKQKQPLTHNRLYIMACRNAKGPLKKRYEGYNKKIIANLEQAEKQKSLDKILNAIKLIEEREKKLSTDNDSEFRLISKSYIKQAETLEEMGDFGGASEKAKEIRKHAEEIERDVQIRIDERQKRLEEEIAKKRAVEEQAKREREAKEEAERQEKLAKEKAEQERLAKIRRKKARRRLARIIVFLAIAAAVTAYKLHFEDKLAYSAAVDTIEQSEKIRQLDYAETIMNQLGDDYDDVTARKKQIAADRRFINNQKTQAYSDYMALDEKYRTPEKLAWYEAEYRQGLDLITKQKYEDAVILFDSIIYYGDSNEQIKRAYALKGDDALNRGQYTAAISAYWAADNYKDTAKKITQAETAMLFESGDYAAAYEAYQNLGSEYFTKKHKEWYEQQYANAKKYLDSGDYLKAIEAFQAISYYNDGMNSAAEQLRNAHYSYAAQTKDPNVAREHLLLSESYRDSESLLKQIEADQLFEQGRYEEAYAIYSLLDSQYQTHSEEYNSWFEAARKAMTEDGKLQSAIAGFKDIMYMDSEKYPVKQLMKTAYSTYAQSFLTITGKIDASAIKVAQEYFELAEEDGTESIQKYYYYTGLDALFKENIGVARDAFKAIRGYEDADEYLKRIDAYERADSLLKAQKPVEARSAFMEVGDYLDAPDMAERCGALAYDNAMKLHMTERLAVFEQLGDYKDCKEQIQRVRDTYKSAQLAYAAKNYDEAIQLFGTLDDYLDSQKMLEDSMLGRARLYISEGKYLEGIDALSELDSSLLAPNEIDEAYQAYLTKLKAEGMTYQALAVLHQVSNSDVEALKDYEELMAAAVSTLNTDQAVFEEYQKLTSESDMNQSAAYELAIAAEKAGNVDSAITIWESLGDYADAREHYLEMNYQKGSQLNKTYNYRDAVTYLERIKGYKDSESLLNLSLYRYAGELYLVGEFQKALDIYDSLGDYVNSVKNAEQCLEKLAEMTAEEVKESQDSEPAQ